MGATANIPYYKSSMIDMYEVDLVELYNHDVKKKSHTGCNVSPKVNNNNNNSHTNTIQNTLDLTTFNYKRAGIFSFPLTGDLMYQSESDTPNSHFSTNNE